MINLITIEQDLKPYGFVKLDYGRVWTNGNLAFIGLNFHVLGKPTTKDFETVAKMQEAKIIKVGNSK